MNDYSFNGQKPNETVKAVFKRHPWSYLHSMLLLVLVLIIPWLVYLFFSFTKPFSYSVLIVGVIAIFWLWFIWYLWQSNIVILTNQRILALELKTPINRKVTEVPLKNIQNITFENNGFLQTVLGYGDVAIQTAGSSTNQIVLKNLDSPYDVQQAISKIAKL